MDGVPRREKLYPSSGSGHTRSGRGVPRRENYIRHLVPFNYLVPFIPEVISKCLKIMRKAELLKLNQVAVWTKDLAPLRQDAGPHNHWKLQLI